jgi:GNAT superfamily N-acetyltransferase
VADIMSDAAFSAPLSNSGSGNGRDLTVAIAHSRGDREQALALHRSVYIRRGLLREGDPPLRMLPQARAPGSAIIVAKEAGVVVGTISFTRDTVAGLPMDEIHADEVDAMRARFARIAEVGSLAVDEERRGLGLTMMLFLAAFRWARLSEVPALVACVNPSYRRVYSKLLPFEVLGPCREHARFHKAPSIPIGLDLMTAPARYGSADKRPTAHWDRFFQDTANG